MVLYVEPRHRTDAPLFTHPKVIVTPHSSENFEGFMNAALKMEMVKNEPFALREIDLQIPRARA